MVTWQIKHGPDYVERQRVALAMNMARKFEAWQASFLNNQVTDSGFSGEDLLSDLLDF